MEPSDTLPSPPHEPTPGVPALPSPAAAALVDDAEAPALAPSHSPAPAVPPAQDVSPQPSPPVDALVDGPPREWPAPARPALPAPVGAPAAAVRAWFDTTLRELEPEVDGSLDAAHQAAHAFQRQAKAENTRRTYRAAVRAWCDWCAGHGLSPLPASGHDVAAFLAEGRHHGLAPSTLELRRAAIRHLHRAAHCPVPTADACVAETLSGIRRHAVRKGETPRKKKAATVPVLRRLLAPIPDDLRGLRDRALLLVGFAGALRRSELAAVAVGDLESTTRGLLLTLAHSKGSQEGAVTVPLPYGDSDLCPVRALERWLAAASIDSGPVFRRIWLPPQPDPTQSPPLPRVGSAALTAQSVGLIVQARAVAAGFGRRELGGHSLKRGALTTGMDRGVHPARLKRLGRHKSFDVLGEYLEFGDLFEGHPLQGVL